MGEGIFNQWQRVVNVRKARGEKGGVEQTGYERESKGVFHVEHTFTNEPIDISFAAYPMR